MQELSKYCNSTAGCSGFTWMAAITTNAQPFGFIKFEPVQPQCLSFSSFATFYAATKSLQPAHYVLEDSSYPVAPHRLSTGAIIGSAP